MGKEALKLSLKAIELKKQPAFAEFELKDLVLLAFNLSLPQTVRLVHVQGILTEMKTRQKEHFATLGEIALLKYYYEKGIETGLFNRDGKKALLRRDGTNRELFE